MSPGPKARTIKRTFSDASEVETGEKSRKGENDDQNEAIKWILNIIHVLVKPFKRSISRPVGRRRFVRSPAFPVRSDRPFDFNPASEPANVPTSWFSISSRSSDWVYGGGGSEAKQRILFNPILEMGFVPNGLYRALRSFVIRGKREASEDSI